MVASDGRWQAEMLAMGSLVCRDVGSPFGLVSFVVDGENAAGLLVHELGQPLV